MNPMILINKLIRWPSGIERLLLDRQTWGLIPSRVKPTTLKLVLTASLLDVQHFRDSVENKPASLLGVPLGRALKRNSTILVW